MDDGKALRSMWQSLLQEFQPLFTRGGWGRCVDWVTGIVPASTKRFFGELLLT